MKQATSSILLSGETEKEVVFTKRRLSMGMILLLVGSSPLIFYISLTICEYRINKKYGLKSK
jgi:hypothetical protein